MSGVTAFVIADEFAALRIQACATRRMASVFSVTHIHGGVTRFQAPVWLSVFLRPKRAHDSRDGDDPTACATLGDDAGRWEGPRDREARLT